MNRIKKALSWAAAALGGLLALLLLAVIMAPRIINTDSVRTAIEGTISRELGGTLTFDRITLSVLPRPRISLLRPEIVIPQRVSARLAALDIHPAVLPLLCGKFRISDVRLRKPVASFLLAGTGPDRKTRKHAGQSAEIVPGKVLAVAAKNMQGISIAVDEGSLDVMRGAVTEYTIRGLEARAAFAPAAEIAGAAAPPEQEAFSITGSIAGTVDAPVLGTGPTSVSIRSFETTQRAMAFSGVSGRFKDLSFTLAGTVEDYLSPRKKFDLTINGTAGPEAMKGLGDLASAPARLLPRTPFAFSGIHVTGDRSSLQASGEASVKNGPSLSFDLHRSAESITLRRLAIRDNSSQAVLGLHLADRIADITFSGSLAGPTVENLFEQPLLRFGTIKGDLKARLPLDELSASSTEGMLEAERVDVPGERKVPFVIDTITLHAEGRSVTLDRAHLTLGGSKGDLDGTAKAEGRSIMLDLSLRSETIAWSDLQELFAPQEGRSGREKKRGTEEEDNEEGQGRWKVLGVLHADVGSLRAKRFVFQPVRGDILFEKDRTRYEVRESGVCGIGLTGSVAVLRKGADLSVRMSAKDQQLAPTLACLAGSDLKITGSFEITGSLTARGEGPALLRSLSGPLAFAARNGRVYNDYLVVPILKYQRIAELLANRKEDAKKNGIPYDLFGIRGSVKTGTLAVSEAVIKSPVMNLAAHGDVDLPGERLALTVLIAPFKSIDAVVRNIPILGRIVGGTLVTVPLKVEGPFKDVKVTPLPPSAIGEGLLGIMRRTLELPFQVIDDMSPGRKKSDAPPAE